MVVHKITVALYPLRGRSSVAVLSPLDDVRTYQLRAGGDTFGVFQLDGGGMRALRQLMAPARHRATVAGRGATVGRWV
ncbi:hypothetical protein [Streptomyces sp. WZ-12]|uniref:hypothetical protein n=1 Tax=Streptomyces sp. WZ-12 TaxID=3030210 RepID=UPI002380DA19|nr:hypothetical protein [Streptomyces sp. WZ-12]